MFQIVEVHGRDTVPLRRKNGTLRMFNTGKAATRFCQIISKDGKKFQPRRFSKVDWKQREMDRLANGTYQSLPWPHTIKDHFAHVSAKVPGRVAFTENEQKGIADIQTPIKAGKYLTRFFPHLPSAEVTRLAATFSNQFEENVLQIAETAEDIVEVYRNGPSSCMSHAASEYTCSPHHPTEAYASGDTAVAYMERDGRVTARCVISRSKMLYGRVYGDYERIYPLLQAAGYYDHGNWDGVKLAAIEHGGGYVMPYLDCGYLVKLSEDGKYFVMSDNKSHDRKALYFDASITSGIIGDYHGPSCECAECGCDEYRDDMYDGGDDNYYCAACWEEITSSCYYCGSRRRTEDMHEVRVFVISDRRRPIERGTERFCYSCMSNFTHLLADGTLVSGAMVQTCPECCGTVLFNGQRLQGCSNHQSNTDQPNTNQQSADEPFLDIQFVQVADQE